MCVRRTRGHVRGQGGEKRRALTLMNGEVVWDFNRFAESLDVNCARHQNDSAGHFYVERNALGGRHE